MTSVIYQWQGSLPASTPGPGSWELCPCHSCFFPCPLAFPGLQHGHRPQLKEALWQGWTLGNCIHTAVPPSPTTTTAEAAAAECSFQLPSPDKVPYQLGPVPSPQPGGEAAVTRAQLEGAQPQHSSPFHSPNIGAGMGKKSPGSLWARFSSSTGQIWHVSRMLPTPGVRYANPFIIHICLFLIPKSMAW